MPWGDGTGPRGMGPRTGRGFGYCTGYNAPGYATPGPGRGWGRGFGRGRGRGFWARAFGWGPTAPQPIQPTKEQEAQMLKQEETAIESEIKSLKEELEQVKKRVKELK